MSAIDLTWQNSRDGRDASTERSGRRRWGDAWPSLRRRLAVLLDAPTLSDIRGTPGKPHTLTGDLPGRVALNVTANYRLVFRSAEEPAPLLTDGGLDWAAVRSIIIEGVIDYHGH